MHEIPVYYIIGVAGAMMTAFYMFRLYATTFLGNFRGTEDQQHHLHESPSAMTIPLIILAILAVVGGFLGIPEVYCQTCKLAGTFPESCFCRREKWQTSEIPASTEWMLMGISTVLALAMVLICLVQVQQKT